MNKQELSALCAAFGPSGREEDVCGLIRNITEGLADETRVDALGNLILHKAGTSGKRLTVFIRSISSGRFSRESGASSYKGGVTPFSAAIRRMLQIRAWAYWT